MVYRLLSLVGIVACIFWLINSPGAPPLVALIGILLPTFSKAYHAVVGLRILSIAPTVKPIINLRNYRYSFTRDEYINPMILADLEGYLSDSGDQVVAVNIADSNRSNRYVADITTDENADPSPIVTAVDSHDTHDKMRYSYQWLGCSLNGIHVLLTAHSGGGSGIFCGIILVTVVEEPTIEIERRGAKKGERFTVKKVAYMPLGDRYSGTVKYRFKCLLTVGPCLGRASVYDKRRRLLIW